jgi:hypothetical protein
LNIAHNGGELTPLAFRLSTYLYLSYDDCDWLVFPQPDALSLAEQNISLFVGYHYFGEEFSPLVLVDAERRTRELLVALF